VPFPARLLNDNEEVVLDLRSHWVSLAGPAAALVAAIVLAVAVSNETDRGYFVIPMLIVVLVALVWLLARMARWATTSLVVTSDRLVVRYGVLARHGREMPLERINDITVSQTLFMRMLRAGDLVIESAGERGQQAFPGCPNPGLVQNEIYRQMELAAERDNQRSSGHRQLHPLEQLEKLHELHRRGVISQAEFDHKKAQLLGRM